MKSKRSLLVTGAGGMLGNAFIRRAKRLKTAYSPVFFAYHRRNDVPVSFDALNNKSVNSMLAGVNPDIIINCAAMTIVEDCEKNPGLAFKINADFPQTLAVWTKKHHRKLVHYSTDAVFDGKKGNYIEKDNPNPLNVYAKSKLKGEQSVLKTDPNALVLRTNIIGIRGHKPYPLAEWILRQLAAGKKITGFTDVTFAPLFTKDLVDLTILAIEKKLTGLYHLNAKNPVSKYRFAKLLAGEFGYNLDLVIPTKSDLILSTPRPLKTYLNPTHFSKTTGIILPTVSEEVRRLKQFILSTQLLQFDKASAEAQPPRREEEANRLQ